MRESKRDFILAVVGLVVGAIGVPFFLAGRQMREAAVLQATKYAQPDPALLQESRIYAEIGVGCFILGGAILVVALVLFLIDRSKRKKQAAERAADSQQTRDAQEPVVVGYINENKLTAASRAATTLAAQDPGDPILGSVLAAVEVLETVRDELVDLQMKWSAPRSSSELGKREIAAVDERVFKALESFPENRSRYAKAAEEQCPYSNDDPEDTEHTRRKWEVSEREEILGLIAADMTPASLLAERPAELRDEGEGIRIVLASLRHPLRDITIGPVWSKRDDWTHRVRRALPEGLRPEWRALQEQTILGDILGPGLADSVRWLDVQIASLKRTGDGS